MNSCLYECRVLHQRFVPKSHRFLYRIFLFAIDLDELEALSAKLRFFSVNAGNVFSFRERDFFPTRESEAAAKTPRATPGALKARLVAYLRTRDIDLTGGRITLVSLPRIFGYLFNPVSFYFCFDRSGQPVAALAEVTNTFKEMKPYFLGASAGSASVETKSFHGRMPKYFYVSPFSDVDVEFDFNLRVPGEKLSVQIDDFVGAERTLTSVLQGPRRALTSARLAWYTVKYPFLTLRVIALIHWHAFRLWFKRVPWFAKAARAADQRELMRPHQAPLRPEAAALPPAADLEPVPSRH